MKDRERYDRRTIYFLTEVWRMRYINVVLNPLGTVPNAPLASDPVKEFHPPILRILVMHGVQVKRDRESVCSPFAAHMENLFK